MADNVTMNDGSGGKTAATAEVSFSGDTADIQLVAPTLLSGSEGSWTYELPVAGAGVVSAGVQRITLASNDPAVALLGTIDTDTGVIAAGYAAEGAALGSGVLIQGDDGTDRQNIAVDTDGNVQVDIVSGTVTVSGTVAATQSGTWNVVCTNAGTFAVQAAQSGTWNINNVSGTISLPTGASTAAKQPALGTAGSASTDVITVQGIASMTPLLVDASGSTQPVSGTVTANQGGTWNITNVSGTISLPTGAATETTLSTLNGKVTACNTGAVVISSGTITTVSTVTNLAQMGGVAISLNVGNVDTGTQRVTIASDDFNLAAIKLATEALADTVVGNQIQVDGAVAHDSADSGNPIKTGARASATLSDDTMVANGDRTDSIADLDGAVITRPQYPLGDSLSERVSNTDGSSTAFTNFAATASARNYVYGYSIFRTDAGTTPIYVDFRDGTGGSILWSVVIPPNGGANLASPVPLFKTTANTALAYDVSAATTTVYISINGCKSKV